jgi:hypothetical protein
MIGPLFVGLHPLKRGAGKMQMIGTRLLALLLLFLLTGCGLYQSKPHQLKFVLDPNDHDFALETTTGTLCKTWQWEHTPKQPIDAIPVCFLMGH